MTFSIVIEVDRQRLTPERRPLVSLATGLAIVETLHDLVPDADLGLKWPNDVLLQSRKVCGILIESPPRPVGRLVAGIGLNVNNSFALAPADLQPKATSLRDATQRDWDLNDVLIGVLRHFAELLDLLTANRLDLTARWRQRCVLTGRVVQLRVGRQSLSGVCRGIDEHGALLLATANGLECCPSGTVCQITEVKNL